MAAKGQSFAEKFSRWGVAVSNLKEHLEEVPHITADLAEMERLLTQVRELEVRRDELVGQAREIGAQIRELTKVGEKLRTRLGANLQGKFGPTSEALVKFGFKPRRIPRRTRVVEKPAPEAPPAPPSTVPVTKTAEPA